MPSGFFAYVGCYTTPERHARGNGINVYHVNETLTTWRHLQTMPTLDNPSFLSLDRGGNYICAIHGDRNYISSYAIDPRMGLIEQISGVESGGQNPVHLAFDITNRFIVVPNYAEGTVTSIAFDATTGTLGAIASSEKLPGERGPHRIEQNCAHPHGVTFDPAERFLYVPDKGLDRIFVFRFHEGRLRLINSIPTREGAGPRHIAFHPAKPYAYVINELDCTVTFYRHDRETGELIPRQTVLALPDCYTGNGRGAEIALSPDGTFVIASLRGADMLSVLCIDEETGMLRLDQSIGSGGRTPRFFSVVASASAVLVAHEASDTIGHVASTRQGLAVAGVQHCVDVGSPSSIVLKPLANQSVENA
ncbi:lactonase family protein [Acetobacter senegalensis]|uniref:lactonase family protein n=1 Tax=Acetobacter senegalensis TaxID=446692 RepID=UPI001EDA9926|nr:lactonase family protein [Acetobacter senegalensis]MCG4255132.1 lactonase family protein [Acetobacter senegalensis]